MKGMKVDLNVFHDIIRQLGFDPATVIHVQLSSHMFTIWEKTSAHTPSGAMIPKKTLIEVIDGLPDDTIIVEYSPQIER